MCSNPRARGILQEEDVEVVVDRFREEYDNSLIYRRFTLAATDGSLESAVQAFLRQMWPHCRPTGRCAGQETGLR
jgi:hypothetical protein